MWMWLSQSEETGIRELLNSSSVWWEGGALRNLDRRTYLSPQVYYGILWGDKKGEVLVVAWVSWESSVETVGFDLISVAE